MVDTHERGLPLVDYARQVAEPADVPDVERCDDVRGLDLPDRAITRIRAFRNHELEALRDASGIGDRDRDTAGLEQIPHTEFTANSISIRIDIRGQHNEVRA